MATHEDDDSLVEPIANQLRALMFRGWDAGFWEGLNQGAFLPQFENVNADVLRTICPLWDLRPESLRFNKVAEEALVGAELYVATRAAFISCCADCHIYTLRSYKDYSCEFQIQRVIGHWIKRKALTPLICPRSLSQYL